MSEGTTLHDSDLGRLCAIFGIATGYHDIWGTWHSAPRETLLALLAGFGAGADTPDNIARAESVAHAAAWRTVLPSVIPIAAGAEKWALSMRNVESAARFRWTVVEEGGGRHEGEVDFASLQETARVNLDGEVICERRLQVEVSLPPGYHRFCIEGRLEEALIVSAPACCYRPPALEHVGRVWGPAVQLYSLRSERNWGIGDFGDLAQLVELCAAMGAGIVGLNPLHALFSHNPAHASPYSPSSRLRLNVLYLDVEAIESFRDCEPARQRVRSADFQRRLAALREAPMVDYPGVARAKTEILELLYRHFRDCHLGPETVHGQAFREFQATSGKAMRQHAACEALQAHFHAADAGTWGWPVWPEVYRDHTSAAVAHFIDANIERVEYYEYLQWQAELQLARVSARSRVLGMAVGLYLDLAVSVDAAGSDTWASQDCYALDASVGAPPDEFNPNGQGWGLPPLRPDRLRAQRYRLFIDILRENMRDAGALRIDHVMGLMRLFWIPSGKTARDGTYVQYALEEMLAIVALESMRNRCMVIGEDLGTVAHEMRVALSRREVLSYRLLYFERRDGGVFKSPNEYPRDALVAVGTHDLATLAGWWTGRDLQLRLELGLLPNREVCEKQLVDRAQERVRLMLALQDAGLLPPAAVVDSAGSQTLTPEMVTAIHAFVASTPSRVMMLQIEDAVGVAEQVNMPGTTQAHPNWKRKLPETLDSLFAGDRLRNLAGALAKVRPHLVHPLHDS